MKRITLTLCAATVMLFSCNDGDKPADDKTDGKDSSKTTTTTDKKVEADQPLDSAAMMAAWGAYATPGTAHAWMAKSNGNWDQEMSYWMDSKAPAQQMKTKCVGRMILGGRYQELKVTGNMMGQPFEGLSLMAYDNHKKVFVNTWMDNMGTGIVSMEGPWDSTSNTLTLKGKGFDPMSGKEVEMRQVITIVDDKTQKMEMYCTKGGSEFKNMEGTMKKK